jgi:GNAT superfamily N-acetyltransferase
MQTTIRYAMTLTDEEERLLFGWGEDIFAVARHGIEWRPKTWNIVLSVGGQLVGNAAVLRHTVSVGGQPVDVGGVGDVVTLPHVQRQGYAQAALHEAVAFLTHELRLPFGLLFCIERLRPYYARQGWQQVHAPVWIEQPAGRRVSPLPVMVLPLAGQAWPSGMVDLQSLPW